MDICKIIEKEGPFSSVGLICRYGNVWDTTWDVCTFATPENSASWIRLPCFLGFMIPVFSALRLARFNINMDLTPSDFQGVPTPVVGVFLGGIMLATLHISYHRQSWILLAFFFIFGPFMMISEFSIIKFIPTIMWFQQTLATMVVISMCCIFFLQSPDWFSAHGCFLMYYIVFTFSLNKK